MTRWTYARRFAADADRAALTVWFGLLGGEAVGCLVPGCRWTHPVRDEAAMTAHARQEWAGTVEYDAAPLTGYTGAHTAGEGCACQPRLAVRYPGGYARRPVVVLVHNGPEEAVHGPKAQRVLTEAEQAEGMGMSW